MSQPEYGSGRRRRPVISGSRFQGERLGAELMTDPLLHPEFASERSRVKRAWLFVVMSLVAPGSVQLVAGHRRFGRRVFGITLGLWVFLLLLLGLWLVKRQLVLALLTSSWLLFALVGLLLLMALVWVLVLVDTLRIIQVRHLPRKARGPVVLTLALLMGLVGGGLTYSAYIAAVGGGAISRIFAGSGELKASEGRYNILLMGGDAGADRVGRRPDSITLVSIDAVTGQALTISLPRNLQNAVFSEDSPLWGVYPQGFSCGDECILNALYPYVVSEHADLYPGAEDPGAEAMMDAVSGITGLEVTSYVLVDMAGFEQLIDAMGGITLKVGGRVPIGGGTNAVTGEPNPIEGYIEPGVQKLDGFHALWYARSREGASDYDRQARQRCVQAAMLKQLDPANLLTKFADITAAGEQIVETNLPSRSLSVLGDVALKSKNYSLIQYAAGPPYYDAMFPTYPDFATLQADIQAVIRNSAQGITPTPLAGAQQVLSGELASVIELETASSLSENGTCSVP